jgi:DNA polymerase bacteriophage-type
MPILFRDYETRGVVDLRSMGVRIYASHASTEVLCCAYALDLGPVQLWTPGMPVPDEFIEAARNPEWLVSAFNDTFERRIEQFMMVPRHGWPLVPIERHRCSQAAALALALPANLSDAAAALGIEQQKDAAGHKLMLQMSRPRRPRADEDPNGVYWFDDSERLDRLYEYCKQDVATERALHERIGFLSPAEQRVWEVDAIINERGVFLDDELLNGALRVATAAEKEIELELAAVTSGAVTSVNEVARLIAWLKGRGCEVDDVRKGTLRRALARKDLAPDTRRAMELRLAGAHAAARKLVTMRNWRGDDGRARDTLKYHVAATGRWASWGIQVHNLKRPQTDDLGAAIAAVSGGNLGRVQQQFPDPMSVVGDVGRAIIRAAPGTRLLAADFSGIESRLTAWLSGQQSKVNEWVKFDHTGDPRDEPYLLLGKRLGQPEESARAIGKTADLAFGYMGSVGAWQKLAPDDKSSEEQIQKYKQGWRDEHPKTVHFWRALDRGAVRAIQQPNTVITCGRVSFTYDGTFLYMRLPSGRALAYPFPRLHTNERGDCVVIFKDNAAGKWVDCRHGQGAYGGTWIENAVQAVARDLFADALLRLETAGYPVVLHVHDEIVCELPVGNGSLEEFHKLMVTPPAWADGLPIAAKARNGDRFAKIEPPRAAEPAPVQPACSNTLLGPEILQQNEQTPPDEAPTPIAVASESAPPLVPKLPQHPELPPPWHGAAEDYAMQYQAQTHSTGNGRWRDLDDTQAYPHGEQEEGNKTATFVYQDAAGRPYLQVRKFERVVNGKRSKSFPQYHQENGRWVKDAPKGPRIPYRLPQLIAAPLTEPVVITEGEKDADNVAALGLITTTNPEGAKQWQPELNGWFVGRQRIYITEDNDEDGRAHTAKITNALRDVVPEIYVIAFPELEEKQDVSDWLELGHTQEELLARAKKVAPHPGYTLVRASDVVPRKLDWLWEGHLLRGSLELLAGLPGMGKSQAQCSYVACATTGNRWPDGTNGMPPGNVIMLTAEDNIEQILVPRLIAAGANLERITFLKSIRKDNKDRRFLLGEDIEALGRAIINENAQLVTIDPITAYMGGKLDSHRVTDVRDQLGPLAEIAERTNVALSAITHPPKNAGPRALDHFIGSQAFVAAARLAHLTIAEIAENEHGKHDPTGRRLFTSIEKNVTGRLPALAYRIVPAEAGDIPITKIVWEGIVDMSADEALAAAAPKKGDRQGVVNFLLDMLANSPVPIKTIEDRADAHGFSKEQLRYARQKMGVVVFKEKGKFEGGWFWALPQHAPQDWNLEETTT